MVEKLLLDTGSLTVLLPAEVEDRERTIRTLSVKCQRMESEVSELQAAVVDLAVDERVIESEKARMEMEGKKRQVILSFSAHSSCVECSSVVWTPTPDADDAFHSDNLLVPDGGTGSATPDGSSIGQVHADAVLGKAQVCRHELERARETRRRIA